MRVCGTARHQDRSFLHPRSPLPNDYGHDVHGNGAGDSRVVDIAGTAGREQTNQPEGLRDCLLMPTLPMLLRCDGEELEEVGCIAWSKVVPCCARL
jgi:hypothetical protein